jgi:hypothetical protein
MSAMDEARTRSTPVNEMWALLGALGMIVLISAAEVGAGARPFDPPDVTPTGPLAFLVEAADLAWSPPILRSAAVIAGLLVAIGAVVLAAARRPWPRWAAAGLTALVVLLMTVPGVALQAGLRQSTEPWFFTNDSTYQIELGGDLIRDGETPYGHDFRTSGMERVYTLDGSATARARERQVALEHFAYFPGTPLTAVPWGLLPEPWSDYRFFVLLCTLAAGAAALLFRGPLAWRLALGALIAASPLAIRSGWFGQADAPAILFTILAFAAAMRRSWIWCGLAIAAAVLLKQFALFAIPFLGLLALQRGGRAGAWRTAIAFAIPVTAGFIPFLIADAHALWEDTITYGGSIYPIIGYGLAPLLVKAGLLTNTDPWPFYLVALLTWLPATLLLLRAQSLSRTAWMAGAGFAASIFVLFFASRVFQETYVIWPLAGIALAGLLWLDERDRGPLLEPGGAPSLRGG